MKARLLPSPRKVRSQLSPVKALQLAIELQTQLWVNNKITQSLTQTIESRLKVAKM
ncbi:hypothetical protein HCG51_08150 [Tolypothrix sp. PCC 7910]|uniref:hypothetical protein n=1 Tax=Tolypothrix sp. PCC 7910 TaxID=2099387 RepID=UPI0014279040|nr:hypothetical protein [Tolypothrix sp. PCC 7910]QIR36724.1 hypothetical protein HCG51_08150 [Tolypothrix sp. PCC 7910]